MGKGIKPRSPPPVVWARPWQQNAIRSSTGAIRKSVAKRTSQMAHRLRGLLVREGGWWQRLEGEETGIIIIIFTYDRGQTDVCLKSDKKRPVERAYQRLPGKITILLLKPKLGKINWRKRYSFIHIPPTVVLRLSLARYRIRVCAPFGVISSHRRRPGIVRGNPPPLPPIPERSYTPNVWTQNESHIIFFFWVVPNSMIID